MFVCVERALSMILGERARSAAFSLNAPEYLLLRSELEYSGAGPR